MKLESIHIEGFGCLVERAIDLLSGLNIFYGRLSRLERDYCPNAVSTCSRKLAKLR